SWFENRFFVPRKPIQAGCWVPWHGRLLLCGRPLRPAGGRAADEQRKLASIHWGPPLLSGRRNFFNLPQTGFCAKDKRGPADKHFHRPYNRQTVDWNLG